MNMDNFIGQKRVIEQIGSILSRYKHWNIILRGHYGYGKTTLIALLLPFCIASYQIAAPVTIVNRLYSTHVIDEAHLVNHFEYLYPVMEEDNFVFCTNMGGKLPEPLVNRCFVFRLDEYTPQQLAEIVLVHSILQDTPISTDTAEFIAARCKQVPRTGVMLMRKFVALAGARGVPADLSTAERIFQEDFMVDNNGFDNIDRAYLNALSDGYKSKRTLQMLLGVDSDEIDLVERHLIRRGLVVIESRGRRLA